jgi:GH15 family glucan-1,4-alpha-glucosidase
VRVGNAAFEQFQLDIVGEVLEVGQLVWQLRQATGAQAGAAVLLPEAWQQIRALLDYLENAWRLPDRGIWEVRGPARHFVHSKIMAWVAFDRACWYVEHLGVEGPAAYWRALADQIHAEVCARGFDRERNTFVQCYEGRELDASLLLVGMTGFLPWDDPRTVGTVAAIEAELLWKGFVYRYQTGSGINLDGLHGHEGAFLPCSFWLVECLARVGRVDDARRLFERAAAVCNDVGLVAEEYDPELGRLVGNFPQAFTHVFLVQAALALQETTVK